MTINILLADDSEVIRFLFSKALEREPDMHVVATASDGVQALELTKKHLPDVIVLDIEMPNMDGARANFHYATYARHIHCGARRTY
ncbi:MAG: response regulator [Alphaproteobacteria bacterium]|nr:response regulator [Alphaproteobacteria bacterium]